MFATAVCVLFRIKLRWSKEKNFYDLIIALFLINGKRGIIDSLFKLIVLVLNDYWELNSNEINVVLFQDH